MQLGSLMFQNNKFFMKKTINFIIFLSCTFFTNAQIFNQFYIQIGTGVPCYVNFPSKSSIKYQSIPNYSSNIELGTRINMGDNNFFRFGLLHNNIFFTQKFTNIGFAADIKNNTKTSIMQKVNLKQFGLALSYESQLKNNRNYQIGIQFYKVISKSTDKKVTGTGISDSSITDGDINNFSKLGISTIAAVNKYFRVNNKIYVAISPQIKVEAKAQSFFFNAFKALLIVPQISLNFHYSKNKSE